MNPPGPNRNAIISQLEMDKDRMHDEIQELSAKLLRTGNDVDQMAEKSAKYKKVCVLYFCDATNP